MDMGMGLDHDSSNHSGKGLGDGVTVSRDLCPVIVTVRVLSVN